LVSSGTASPPAAPAPGRSQRLEGRILSAESAPPEVFELAADLAALRESAALVELDDDLLEVAGPDRLRLLNGLVTADVKSVASGTSVAGFFTSGQGRILSDFRLLALAETCWLALPSGFAAAIGAHLEKYKVASRVEISRAGELAAAVSAREEAAGGAGALFGGGDRFYFVAAAAGAEERILPPSGAEGFAPRRVSAAAVELARIEAGELRFGTDFSNDNFPQETGREGDVSYTKGCYLGQEVVARIHYRGGVQRMPRGLRFAGEELPAAGTELLLEGRPVGRATSVASSPRFGAIGLGLLHRRAAEPGTVLHLPGGGEASVVELPFGSTPKEKAG
jgi:folate-binding protein YgfZ